MPRAMQVLWDMYWVGMDMPAFKIAQIVMTNTHSILTDHDKNWPGKEETSNILMMYKGIKRVKEKLDVGIKLIEMGYAPTKINWREGSGLYIGIDTGVGNPCRWLYPYPHGSGYGLWFQDPCIFHTLTHTKGQGYIWVHGYTNAKVYLKLLKVLTSND